MQLHRLGRCVIDAGSYDLCPKANSGYYYIATENKCRHTSKDVNYVCIESMNSHRSISSCEFKCVVTSNHDYCDILPRFVGCSDIDIKGGTWWFFKKDQGRCSEWPFPEGSCPKLSGEEYRSEADCQNSCSGSGARQKPSCQWPSELVSCPPEDMQKPVFFNKLVKPPRCQNITHDYVRAHRYHNKMNLFATEEQCQKLCFGKVKSHRPKGYKEKDSPC